MTENAYIPSGGIAGKIKRLQSRLMARDPITIQPARPTVSVTFDDFPKSAVTVGAHELENRNWRGTFYAAAGFAGRRTHHGEMFDASDIIRLQDAGHEIACHTLDHVDLGRADVTVTQAQSNANREALMAMGLRGGLSAFAYPYGEAAPQNKRYLSGRHKTLRGVRPGINRTGDDRNLLKAVGIDGGEDGIRQAHDLIEQVAGNPGWLILFAHDIQPTPTEWGCTPAQYVDILEHVQEIRADVMPVSEAYRRLLSA